MALTFPILSLNPSSFSMEPINKSLVPEDTANLYASGRELYIGNPYIINLKYTNLSPDDAGKLLVFCEMVGTLIPFQFMFEQYIYNVTFSNEYQLSKQDYNLFNMTLQMKTFVASIDNFSNLETNLAKRWFYLTSYPYLIIDSNGSYISRALYDTVSTSFYVNGETITATFTPPQPQAYLYCATIENTPIQVVAGAVYQLKTKLFLYSGRLPYMGVSTGPTYFFDYTTPRLLPGYQVAEFTPTYVDAFILIGNDANSEWSLELELIRKTV